MDDCPSEHSLSKSPWVELKELIQKKDSELLDQYLNKLSPGETARSVSRLSEQERLDLINILDPTDAAELIEELPAAQAVELIEDLPDKKAAKVVEELKSDQQADLLGALGHTDAQAILEKMGSAEAASARQLLSYPDGTAGSLMSTEIATFRGDQTVDSLFRSIRSNLEKYSSYDVLYGYVVNSTGVLQGVIKIRDLLFARPEALVSDIMLKSPITLKTDVQILKIQELFDQHSFLALPVLDNMDRMIGLVNRSAIQLSREQKAEKDFMQSAGILGGEELRTLPFFPRSRRRLSILSINIFLNLMAASIIAYFQDTLSSVIVLAVFLPIISDLSGCSGNQAIAVSIRELSVGLIKPRDFKQVLLSELKMGLLNGVALGFLLGLVAFLWKDNLVLGLVVGGALAINTVVAVGLGGTIPLTLRTFGYDPALASAPILTTVTDMFGFLCVLGFATLMLSYLV